MRRGRGRNRTLRDARNGKWQIRFDPPHLEHLCAPVRRGVPQVRARRTHCADGAEPPPVRRSISSRPIIEGRVIRRPLRHLRAGDHPWPVRIRAVPTRARTCCAPAGSGALAHARVSPHRYSGRRPNLERSAAAASPSLMRGLRFGESGRGKSSSRSGWRQKRVWALWNSGHQSSITFSQRRAVAMERLVRRFFRQEYCTKFVDLIYEGMFASLENNLKFLPSVSSIYPSIDPLNHPPSLLGLTKIFSGQQS